jgi:hypothetical protein
LFGIGAAIVTVTLSAGEPRATHEFRASYRFRGYFPSMELWECGESPANQDSRNDLRNPV